MTVLAVRRADLDDLATVARLFDAYRVFYRLPTDLDASSDYVEQPVGFTQLYRSFCSLELGRILVLYDRFVTPEARGTGEGKALFNHAAQLGLDTSAARLELSTAVDNLGAQRLHESLGWKRDLEYLHYELPLS